MKCIQITYNSGSMFLHSDIQCLSTEIGKSINRVFFYFFFLFGVLFFFTFGCVDNKFRCLLTGMGFLFFFYSDIRCSVYFGLASALIPAL